MTANRDLESLLDLWLTEGPTELPDRVIHDALAQIDHQPQRGRFSVPWRNPLMPFARLAAAGAAAVLVTAFVLAVVFRSAPGIGGTPTPTPTPSPSPSPSASSAPTTSLDAATWTAYRSILSYSARYPSNWTQTLATNTWPYKAQPGDSPDNNMTDIMLGPDNRAFVVATQAVTPGVTLEKWYTESIAGAPIPQCFPAFTELTPVTVAGRPGYLHGGLPGCNFTEVILRDAGHIHEFTAYVDLTKPAGGVFDPALFNAFLGTITLDTQ